VLAQYSASAQQPATAAHARPLFKEGYRYLTGAGKIQNTGKALQLFKQSAASGDAQAMNAMGNMYASAKMVPLNMDSALYWYEMAGNNGYSPAFFNLGEFYRTGTRVKQDFGIAADYYKKGSALGNTNATNALAYFYYKGLGVPQDYNSAFKLYKSLAERGTVNAMYFLGLCYRNGYGTEADQALSKEWLLKAAARNDRQAIHELTAEPAPENTSVVSGELQKRVTALKAYREKLTTASETNISGDYTGYAVYYDFSGKYVHEILPLSLSLKKTGNDYEGVWKEGDSITASIKGMFLNNKFVFDSSSTYTRNNYYSYRSPEAYRFDEAALGIKYMGDSVCLSGDMRFYSIKRKEPGQPMFIALSRKTADKLSDNVQLQLKVAPNPTSETVKAHFILSQASRVSLQVVDHNGNVVQQLQIGTLPAGNYIYPQNIKNLPAGSYVLVLYAGNTKQHQLFIKL
jgi:hypothetical protein